MHRHAHDFSGFWPAVPREISTYHALARPGAPVRMQTTGLRYRGRGYRGSHWHECFLRVDVRTQDAAASAAYAAVYAAA